MTSLLQSDTRLVLASASAARASVLRSAGLVFTTRAARIDEAAVKAAARAEDATADETALLLGDLKAERVGRSDTDSLIVGADQILVCDGCWFDKPADMTEAAAQLRALRGRSHVLVTALVCHRGGRRIFHHVTHPRLTMRAFSGRFLEAYLAAEGDTLLATVGAYRLEGLGAHLFEAAEGEHSAILGLPLLPLLGFLRQHGMVVV